MTTRGWTRTVRGGVFALCVIGMVGTVATDLAAQTQSGRGQARGRGQVAPPTPGAGVGLQELQDMFDAFALVQVQRVLQLPDAQYQRFFMRMNRLQDLRRQHGRQRIRLVADLRRTLASDGADDVAVTAAMRALDDAELRFEDETRAARAALDEVLNVRQRARFRLFEEEMERQKIEFITRARQASRQQSQ